MFRFFRTRRRIGVKIETDDSLTSYVNVPPMIASVVNSRLATLHELETVYGLEDLFDLLEIIIINIANQQKKNKMAQERRKRR